MQPCHTLHTQIKSPLALQACTPTSSVTLTLQPCTSTSNHLYTTTMNSHIKSHLYCSDPQPHQVTPHWSHPLPYQVTPSLPPRPHQNTPHTAVMRSHIKSATHRNHTQPHQATHHTQQPYTTSSSQSTLQARMHIHGPLTRYVKLRVAHAPRMPGTFPPPPTSKETASYRSRHASRHVSHARAMMHFEINNPQWRGKHSRHSRRMRNPQSSISGKRPMSVRPPRTTAIYGYIK